MATPGTLSIPNIDGRQVTRIVLSVDTRTEMAAHALWLETFNGESWDKIDGTDKSVSLETALQNLVGTSNSRFPRRVFLLSAIPDCQRRGGGSDLWSVR